MVYVIIYFAGFIATLAASARFPILLDADQNFESGLFVAMVWFLVLPIGGVLYGLNRSWRALRPARA